jgi:large subunit ribosomal protein L16
MGKGKGNVDHWVSKTKAGDILCEIETNNKVLATKALKIAQNKLPILTKIFFN